MKNNFCRIGGRTGKTVIAVFTCFLIDTVRENGIPFYAASAAILFIQHNFKDSLNAALTREIATVIGGILGAIVLSFEKNVYRIPNELLRYLFLSISLIPIINFSVWIKQEKEHFLCALFFFVSQPRMEMMKIL